MTARSIRRNTQIHWAGAGCVLLVLVMFLIESIKDYL